MIDKHLVQTQTFSSAALQTL